MNARQESEHYRTSETLEISPWQCCDDHALHKAIKTFFSWNRSVFFWRFFSGEVIHSSTAGSGSAATAVKTPDKKFKNSLGFIAFLLEQLFFFFGKNLSFSLLTVQLLEPCEQVFQLDQRLLHLFGLDRLQDLLTLLQQANQLVFSQHPGGETPWGLHLNPCGRIDQ